MKKSAVLMTALKAFKYFLQLWREIREKPVLTSLSLFLQVNQLTWRHGSASVPDHKVTQQAKDTTVKKCFLLRIKVTPSNWGDKIASLPFWIFRTHPLPSPLMVSTLQSWGSLPPTPSDFINCLWLDFLDFLQLSGNWKGTSCGFSRNWKKKQRVGPACSSWAPPTN